MNTIGTVVCQQHLLKNKPQWFNEVENLLDLIKSKIGNNFEDLMKYLDENFSHCYFEVEKNNIS